MLWKIMQVLSKPMDRHRKDIGSCIKRKQRWPANSGLIGTFELPEGPSWVSLLSQHCFQNVSMGQSCIFEEAMNVKGVNARGVKDQEEEVQGN